jgi:hypothetical protein
VYNTFYLYSTYSPYCTTYDTAFISPTTFHFQNDSLLQQLLGAQIPLGTGLGFAHKYRGDNGVSVTGYGDGASNQGECLS